MPLADILSLLKPAVRAAMLYGSHARGDAGPDSDIDILQFDEASTTHYDVGPLSVAVYNREQLTTMSERGSLFAMHLYLEGRTLYDPTGELSAIVASFRPRRSYKPILDAIAHHAQILDVDAAALSRNPEGFARLALYLLRTAAAARHVVEFGYGIFAVDALAAALRIPLLAAVFADRYADGAMNAGKVRAALPLLADLTDRRIHNPYGSLEAYAVNNEEHHPLAARMALRVLGGSTTVGYGDLFLDPVIGFDD